MTNVFLRMGGAMTSDSYLALKAMDTWEEREQEQSSCSLRLLNTKAMVLEPTQVQVQILVVEQIYTWEFWRLKWSRVAWKEQSNRSPSVLRDGQMRFRSSWCNQGEGQGGILTSQVYLEVETQWEHMNWTQKMESYAWAAQTRGFSCEDLYWFWNIDLTSYLSTGEKGQLNYLVLDSLQIIRTSVNLYLVKGINRDCLEVEMISNYSPPLNAKSEAHGARHKMWVSCEPLWVWAKHQLIK